jgi:Bifunctional DNA primase/polymerase, N-terminal
MGARLDAALGYRDLGRSVIPVEVGGKLPAIPWKAYQAERATEARVRHWWSRADFNVGIVTGAISNLIVVDVDGRAGGYESLARLGAEHGALDAPEVATAGGGSHLWFAHPGCPVGNTAGALGPGIDTRGDGGFVICPPSVRPDGAYTWCEWLCEVPPLPGWLVEWLTATSTPVPAAPAVPMPPRLAGISSGYGEKALAGELDRLAAAPVGAAGRNGRNHALNKAAFALGQLVGGGELEGERVTGELYQTALDIGLEPGEIPGTIRSGMEAGLRRPRRRR